MAAKKRISKVELKGAAADNAVAAKKSVVPAGRARSDKRTKVPDPAPTKPRGNAVPSARTCPLVLDGELDASDFSPVLCLSCDEFDCSFCEAAAGSGGLRSRLFAAPDEEDSDDEWDNGADFVEEEDDGEDVEEE